MPVKTYRFIKTREVAYLTLSEAYGRIEDLDSVKDLFSKRFSNDKIEFDSITCDFDDSVNAYVGLIAIVNPKIVEE